MFFYAERPDMVETPMEWNARVVLIKKQVSLHIPQGNNLVGIRSSIEQISQQGSGKHKEIIRRPYLPASPQYKLNVVNCFTFCECPNQNTPNQQTRYNKKEIDAKVPVR
jgi:hypothetical protein